MIDLIVAAILAVILGFAAWYVRKARKKGRKCIGCPGGCCSGKNNECAGCGSKMD